MKNKLEKEIEKMIKENNGKYNEEIYLKIFELCENDEKAIKKAREFFNDGLIEVLRNIFGRRNPYVKADGTDATLLEWLEFIL